ncbi:MAG: DUF4405 domain-containing protein [Firmicutes bacterium]|nr:DUF4405 domain-containing protein [Bacillota bacterium]
MKESSLKAIVSILLLALLVILALSGALLYFGKTGQVWGIARYALRNAHTVAALAAILVAALHLFLNRRFFLRGLSALFTANRQAPK